MKVILGVDVGSHSTKVVDENGAESFLSTSMNGTYDFNKSTVLSINGQNYTIGDRNGVFNVDQVKTDSVVFYNCLCTAIAKRIDGKEQHKVSLVTGLPAQTYAENKDYLIKTLQGLDVKLKLDNEPRSFIIEHVDVYPQSAVLALLDDSIANEMYIIIDIGGHTVDVSVFNAGKLISKATYEEGMIHLYDAVTQMIMAKHGVTYDVMDGETILRTKEIIKSNMIVSINKDIDDVVTAHVERLTAKIKAGFKEYNSYKKIYMGGGAIALSKYLSGGKLLEDVYANARAFYSIGVDEFEG